LQEFLKIVPEWEGSQIVGAVVGGLLRELTYQVDIESDVIPLNMSTSDGSKIYRRSLTFLLETAFEDLFPNYLITIDHSVPSGGYFCKVLGRDPLSQTEIRSLQARMKELAEQDIPIIKEQISLDKARAYLRRKVTRIRFGC
jgi:uridine kinase